MNDRPGLAPLLKISLHRLRQLLPQYGGLHNRRRHPPHRRRHRQITPRFRPFLHHDEVAVARDDHLWVNFDTGRSVMGLRAVRDHCIFLDNETNRRTIYEHRPLTCRDHPFSITFSDTGAIEKISLSRIVKCPHEWDGDNSRRELKRIASWNERQEESYVKKVKAWNQKESGPKTRPEFLRFLGFDL